MSEFIDVRQAAAALDVSPQRVRQLIGQGDLKADRLGRVWAVDAASVRRRSRTKVPAGRPYASDRVWAMAVLAEILRDDGPHPADLVCPVGGQSTVTEVMSIGVVVDNPQLRWQLRRYLVGLAGHDDPGAVASRLRHRADGVQHWHVHPSARDDLLEDPRLLVSGTHAAAAHGADLVPGDGLDAYIDGSRIPSLVADHGLVDAEGGDLSLRPIGEDASCWGFRGTDGRTILAPRLIVLADLAQEQDARARIIAGQLWAELRETLMRLDA